MIKKQDNNYITIIIFLFIISRIIFFSYYFIFTNILYSVHFWHYPNLALCQSNDCTFYMSIARSWYQQCGMDTAFFPATPYLVSLSSKLVNYFVNSRSDSLIIEAVIFFNQIFALLSTLLLYNYVAKNYSKIISFWASVIFIFSTEQIYFFTVYSESLFILLLLTIMSLLEKKQFFIASIFSAILSMTRANGFIAALIIVYQKYKTVKNSNDYLKILLYFMIAISGLLLFLTLLYRSCHDILSFVHVQQQFGRKSLNQVLNLNFYQFAKYFLKGNIGDKLAFIFFLIANCYFIKHKKWQDLRILLLFMLPALSSLTMISFSRFLLALPQIYIFFGIMINKLNFNNRSIIILLILAINCLYFYLLINHSPLIW